MLSQSTDFVEFSCYSKTELRQTLKGKTLKTNFFIYHLVQNKMNVNNHRL